LLSAALTYSRTADGAPVGGCCRNLADIMGQIKGARGQSLSASCTMHKITRPEYVCVYVRMTVQISAPSSAHKETCIYLALGDVNYSHITSANPRKPGAHSDVTINISVSRVNTLRIYIIKEKLRLQTTMILFLGSLKS